MLNSTADDATRRIRAGSVLPDEVHLLQLPHGRVFKGIVRAVCSARFAARSPNSRVCSVKMKSRTSRRPRSTPCISAAERPAFLNPRASRKSSTAIRASFPSQFEEVTLEADPETISPEKAAAWREAGFNRISMGVQSFDDAELRAAGRMHRRADVFQATKILRAAGFANLSFDLIAGLPHQTDRSWEESVEQLLHLRPEHVSIYMMEIDEGSRLGLEVLQSGERYSAKALPSDDSMANYYEYGCRQLAAAGYGHYEISNWGLPGFESRHNLKYWRREPYFGFRRGRALVQRLAALGQCPRSCRVCGFRPARAFPRRTVGKRVSRAGA